MKRKTFDNEDSLHTSLDPSSSEATSDDSILEPKHKVFLSHSGAQKEFVNHLCKALEEHCHYPFFDRRVESLSKGVKFPGLIFKAVQQCQLFVVVISEEYFMSKWPMLELNAFVKTLKERKSNMNRGILPLFYGLSVSDLKDEKKRQRWFEKWETFARDDHKRLIKVDDWKFALDELTKFNGLPYDRELKQVVEYESSIVSHICKLLPPDIKWEDSHVQGHVHEVVLEKIKQVKASQLAQVKVFGLYGVGGIGKTTVCKTLCNELSSAFEGRVCHIEFDSTSSNSKELLQKVLIKLTRKSLELVQRLDEGECKNVLFKNLMKQKIFLAIDNVWDNANSIKQASMFLKVPLHEDSLVLVTTRAQRALELLGVDGVACLEMPELGQGNATNLFLYHATNGQQFTSEEDIDFIDLCVKKCYFSKGDGGGFHYHPLALEALGRQVGCHKMNPCEWAQVLSSMQKFKAFSEGNEVFDVLRSSFDLLRPIEQDLFMDVGVFLRCLPEREYFDQDQMGWLEHLCALYRQDEQQMQILLNSLKGKGLLQDANLSLERIYMHDLYNEFLILEAQGKLVEASSIGNQRWVYINVHDGDLSKLEVTPAGGCWQDLTRLSIQQDDNHPITHPIESLASIEWKHFSNILVLQLYGLNCLKGTLNLKGLKCLQILQIHDLSCVERLKGLEGLRNLTLFEFFSHSSKLEVIVRQFPQSLKYLDMRVKCVLIGLDVFARCNNLCKLRLIDVEVGVELDLRNCLSLEYVYLFAIDNLQSLLVPSTRMASRLKHLEIGSCGLLGDIQGLSKFVYLECLDFSLQAWKEVPNLSSLTKLQTLTTYGGTDSTKLHIPCQLQELSHVLWKGSINGPNFSGFNQLQVLDLMFSLTLEGLSEMGDLPALRSLNLSYCVCLQRLPDLSKSRNLEELDLDGCCALELHEKDVQTLATLPLLHPVHFSPYSHFQKIKLDLGRQKVLQYMGSDGFFPKSSLNWMEGEWEEKELGRPPITVDDFGNGDSSGFISFLKSVESSVLQGFFFKN